MIKNKKTLRFIVPKTYFLFCFVLLALMELFFVMAFVSRPHTYWLLIPALFFAYGAAMVVISFVTKRNGFEISLEGIRTFSVFKAKLIRWSQLSELSKESFDRKTSLHGRRFNSASIFVPFKYSGYEFIKFLVAAKQKSDKNDFCNTFDLQGFLDMKISELRARTQKMKTNIRKRTIFFKSTSILHHDFKLYIITYHAIFLLLTGCLFVECNYFNYVTHLETHPVVVGLSFICIIASIALFFVKLKIYYDKDSGMIFSGLAIFNYIVNLKPVGTSNSHIEIIKRGLHIPHYWVALVEQTSGKDFISNYIVFCDVFLFKSTAERIGKESANNLKIHYKGNNRKLWKVSNNQFLSLMGTNIDSIFKVLSLCVILALCLGLLFMNIWWLLKIFRLII